MPLTTTPSAPELKTLLKTHFGYDNFLSRQEDVINHVLNQKDSLVIMPTGGGKSLCYQLPALAKAGTAVVISPLIALMKDQVDALKANGIKAAYYNSSQPHDERQDVLRKLTGSELKLLYVAPESLSLLQPYFTQVSVNLFAIDEAHCISAWGHDFRPSYTQLAQLKDRNPDIPIIALTATADRATREDVARQLHIPDAKTFIASFDRPNIFLDVRPGQNRKKQILTFLANHRNQSGIIYCLSRKNTENLAATLNIKGYTAEAYHAGLEADERSRIQENFTADRTPIVVATIAFGMGIDKSDVRWVIHYNMPKNIDGYYQEIGRCGRDGLPAQAILFHSYSDVMLLRRFAEESSMKDFHLAKLNRMQQYAESLSCRRKTLLGYFGEYPSRDCQHCDVCQHPPKYFDGTIIAQKVCSAIARLKEQEALNTVVDVLRGAKNEKVLKKNYQRIKTYGALKDLSWIGLQDYIIQLVNQGLLEILFHEKSRLVLTSRAKKVLFKGEKVKLATPVDRKSKSVKSSSEPTHERGELFEALRNCRTTLARKANVPPYIIFGDKSLEDMEERLPQSQVEFADIFGVGQSKLERYAEEFLSVIRNYFEKHPEELKEHKFEFGRQTNMGSTSQSQYHPPRKTLYDKLIAYRHKLAEELEVEDTFICSSKTLQHIADQKPRSPEALRKIPLTADDREFKNYLGEFLKIINRHLDENERQLPSHERSYRLYTDQHLEVEEIAQRRGIAENTVINHFIKMYREGHAFDFSPFISPQEIEQINEAKENLGAPDTLKTYYDHFNGKVTYPKIRMGLLLGKSKIRS